MRIPAQTPTRGRWLGRELGGARIFQLFVVSDKLLISDGSSLVLSLSGLRRRKRKSFKPLGRSWVSCTPNILTPSLSSGPSSSSCQDSYLYVHHNLGSLLFQSFMFSLQDGSWAQEAIEGMFNRTVAISYPNFKFSFTIWMLGKADSYLKQLRASNGLAKGY